jgi:hypothetical protein
VPERDVFLRQGERAADLGPQRNCAHDSMRSDGLLDDHCLKCGVDGYWNGGLRRDKTHPSGKLLIAMWPGVLPTLPIHEHVRLAERHANRALTLAYGDKPQPWRVRVAIGRAQSILISLISNGRLR